MGPHGAPLILLWQECRFIDPGQRKQNGWLFRGHTVCLTLLEEQHYSVRAVSCLDPFKARLNFLAGYLAFLSPDSPVANATW